MNAVKVLLLIVIIMAIILPFHMLGVFDAAIAISDVSIYNITYSGATVKWRTDVSATSQIDYGDGNFSNYTISKPVSSQPVTYHYINIDQLKPDTLYHLRIRTATGSKEAESKDLTFTTAHISKIAYVSNKTGRQEIYVMYADGSNQRQLTSGNSTKVYQRLAWSPDGKWIAFVSKDREISDYYNVPHEIYVIAADGSNRAHLTNDTGYPTWSEDSTKLGLLDKYWILNPDGTSWRGSTKNDPDSVFDPRISPDHKRVSAISWDRDYIPFIRGIIYTTDINTINKTQATGTFYFDEVSGLTWAPDSWAIAFVSMEGNYPSNDKHSAIYIVNADGTGQQRLTDGSHRDSQPAWSPDGKKIVFVSDVDENNQIYVMNFDGSGRERITQDSFSNTSPAWTP